MNLDQRLKLVNSEYRPESPPDWLMLIVWVASKPQLIHSQSKQSITASDDYYSLESDQSYDETLRQFQTPPSHLAANVI